MKALFIGRFQPFHKGHLRVVKNIFKKYDKIIIGIGSSQYKNTKDNPFSLTEREEMIKKTFEKENIKNFKIIKIPDIHNPPKWVDHVLNIYSDFDVICTNNSFTKKLFEDKNIKVFETPLFNKKKYSGNEIRRRIKNDEDWKKLVPEPVYDIIIKNNGVKRIKKFSD